MLSQVLFTTYAENKIRVLNREVRSMFKVLKVYLKYAAFAAFGAVAAVDVC